MSHLCIFETFFLAIRDFFASCFVYKICLLFAQNILMWIIFRYTLFFTLVKRHNNCLIPKEGKRDFIEQWRVQIILVSVQFIASKRLLIKIFTHRVSKIKKQKTTYQITCQGECRSLFLLAKICEFLCIFALVTCTFVALDTSACYPWVCVHLEATKTFWKSNASCQCEMSLSLAKLR